MLYYSSRYAKDKMSQKINFSYVLWQVTVDFYYKCKLPNMKLERNAINFYVTF